MGVVEAAIGYGGAQGKFRVDQPELAALPWEARYDRIAILGDQWTDLLTHRLLRYHPG